jgi:hypothetical protein
VSPEKKIEAHQRIDARGPSVQYVPLIIRAPRSQPFPMMSVVPAQQHCMRLVLFRIREAKNESKVSFDFDGGKRISRHTYLNCCPDECMIWSVSAA